MSSNMELIQLTAQGIMVAIDTTVTTILAELDLLTKKTIDASSDVNLLSSRFFHHSLIAAKLKFCTDNLGPIKASLEQAIELDKSLLQPYQFCIVAQDTLEKLKTQNAEELEAIKNILSNVIPKNAVVH